MPITIFFEASWLHTYCSFLLFAIYSFFASLVLFHSLPVNFSVFFKHITAQLLAGAQEWDKLLDGGDHIDKNNLGGVMLLMGEAFARISRRGSTGTFDQHKQIVQRIIVPLSQFM